MIRRPMTTDPASLPPVFTIGHSTRSIPAFVELLRVGDVRMVVDVRTIPRSRTNPQYNLDSFPGALAEYQIGHRYIAALGGLRGRTADIDPSVNALWRNRSFHNYADYALTARFREGLDELLELSAAQRCAIMCSEAVWWRCHRRLIADHLLVEGRAVLHLMEPRRADPASLTPGAVVEGGTIVYPERESA